MAGDMRLGVWSPEDMKTLKQMIAAYRSMPRSTIRPAVPDELGNAPDMYMALAPGGGIPARVGFVLGHAHCQVFQEIGGVLENAGFFEQVFNLSEDPVEPNSLVQIFRDKFGTWNCGDTSLTEDPDSLVCATFYDPCTQRNRSFLFPANREMLAGCPACFETGTGSSLGTGTTSGCPCGPQPDPLCLSIIPISFDILSFNINQGEWTYVSSERDLGGGFTETTYAWVFFDCFGNAEDGTTYWGFFVNSTPTLAGALGGSLFVRSCNPFRVEGIFTWAGIRLDGPSGVISDSPGLIFPVCCGAVIMNGPCGDTGTDDEPPGTGSEVLACTLALPPTVTQDATAICQYAECFADLTTPPFYYGSGCLVIAHSNTGTCSVDWEIWDGAGDLVYSSLSSTFKIGGPIVSTPTYTVFSLKPNPGETYSIGAMTARLTLTDAFGSLASTVKQVAIIEGCCDCACDPLAENLYLHNSTFSLCEAFVRYTGLTDGECNGIGYKANLDYIDGLNHVTGIWELACKDGDYQARFYNNAAATWGEWSIIDSTTGVTSCSPFHAFITDSDLGGGLWEISTDACDESGTGSGTSTGSGTGSSGGGTDPCPTPGFSCPDAGELPFNTDCSYRISASTTHWFKFTMLPGFTYTCVITETVNPVGSSHGDHGPCGAAITDWISAPPAPGAGGSWPAFGVSTEAHVQILADVFSNGEYTIRINKV